MKSRDVPLESTVGATIKNEKARLCVDYSEKNSLEAITILRNAGFRVTATPVSGIIEPELTLGSTSYHGIDEIRELVDRVNSLKAIPNK